jgi:hypothetical protein
MSYIRSASNPESLYIWGYGERVTIAHRVLRPLSSAKEIPASFDVPTAHFDKVRAQWAKGREKASSGGITVEEAHIYLRSGRPVPRRPMMTQITSKAPTEFLIRLSYKKHFILLWRVTWEHVVFQNEQR